MKVASVSPLATRVEDLRTTYGSTLANNTLFYWEAKKKAKWKSRASANEHKIGDRKVTTTFLADRSWLIPPWYAGR